jgi:hypothetical protein
MHAPASSARRGPSRRSITRVGEFSRSIQRLIERQGAFFEPRGERLAIQMRHDQVVKAADTTHVVEATDMRGAQLRQPEIQ